MNRTRLAAVLAFSFLASMAYGESSSTLNVEQPERALQILYSASSNGYFLPCG